MSAFLSGCAIHTVGKPLVGQINVEQKFMVPATILITQETYDKVTRQKPILIGWGRPHTFQLGEMLEEASIQAFSQAFQEVTLVRTPEAAQGKLQLKPTVKSLSFFYFPTWLLWNRPYARVTVQTIIYSDDQMIWETLVSTPRQGTDPPGLAQKLVWNNRLDTTVGGAVAKAMSGALEEITMRMARDPDLRGKIVPSL